MSFDVDTIEWELEYRYQVSNLWSVLDEIEMNRVSDWLIDANIKAEFLVGYGDIRFFYEKDRTLFLLRYSKNDTHTTEDWY